MDVGGGPSEEPPGFTVSVRDENDDRGELALPTDAVDVLWVDDGSVGAITDRGDVHLIDVPTGDAHEVAIEVEPSWRTVARVADGQLAFGYADGHVDVFDLDSGERHARLQISTPNWPGPPQPVDQIASSQNGARIYVTARGLFQFDARTGRQLRWSSDTGISSVAAADDGAIAVGRFDGTIDLLDPDDLSVLATLPGARGVASTLRFSADGRLLLARSNDTTMALYDIETRQRIGDPISVGDADAALRPDGLEIAVAHYDASGVTLWSLDPTTWTRAACTVAGRNLTRAEWETYIADLAPYRASCPNLAFPPS